MFPISNTDRAIYQVGSMRLCEECGAELSWNIVTHKWEDDENDSVFRDRCPETTDGLHVPA